MSMWSGIYILMIQNSSILFQTFEMQSIINFFSHQVFIHVVIISSSTVATTTLKIYKIS